MLNAVKKREKRRKEKLRRLPPHLRFHRHTENWPNQPNITTSTLICITTFGTTTICTRPPPLLSDQIINKFSKSTYFSCCCYCFCYCLSFWGLTWANKLRALLMKALENKGRTRAKKKEKRRTYSQFETAVQEAAENEASEIGEAKRAHTLHPKRAKKKKKKKKLKPER